jgi:hypothetical protein
LKPLFAERWPTTTRRCSRRLRGRFCAGFRCLFRAFLEPI